MQREGCFCAGEISWYFGYAYFSVCLPKREGAQPPASISIHAIRFGIISISYRLLNAYAINTTKYAQARAEFSWDASKVAKRMMAGLCEGCGRCGGKYFQRIIAAIRDAAMLLPLTPPSRTEVLLLLLLGRERSRNSLELLRGLWARFYCTDATTQHGLRGYTGLRKTRICTHEKSGAALDFRTRKTPFAFRSNRFCNACVFIYDTCSAVHMKYSRFTRKRE